MSPGARLRALVLATLVALTTLGGCRTWEFPTWLEHAVEADLDGQVRIVSWNVQKGIDHRLEGDLQHLIATYAPDLLLLQEAREGVVPHEQLAGHFAPAWTFPWPGGTAIGLATLARVRPTYVQRRATAWREFFVTAPKMTLATRYPLAGGEVLLCVNIHALNFERWGTLRFRSQLGNVAEMLAGHDGPAVLAGDLNTWSPKRLRHVQALAVAHGLVEVPPPLEAKTADFGALWNFLLGNDPELSVDRVYQRGFAVAAPAVALPYDSSDHRALMVVLEPLAGVAGKADSPQSRSASFLAR